MIYVCFTAFSNYIKVHALIFLIKFKRNLIFYYETPKTKNKLKNFK